MGNFKFALMMLIRDYKKTIFYALTMVLTIAVSFVFFNIINNDLLIDHSPITIGGGGAVIVPFSTMLSFLIIMFCCFMLFFANDFYVSRKTNDIATMELSGNSFIKSTFHLIYQSMILLLISSPLGVGLGAFFSIISNYIMYQHLDIEASIYHIPGIVYGQTLIVLAIILLIISVFASGYIYRNDLLTLLNQEKTMDFKGNNRGKIPSITYLFLYLFGIYMMFTNDHSMIAYVGPTCVGMLGAMGFLRRTLPELLKKLKKQKLLDKKYALIYISNLNYSLRRSVMLLSVITVSVTMMIAVIAGTQNSPREYITGVMGYFVIVILLVMSIVYKMINEIQMRKTFFYNLWKIGYTKKELIKIIRREVIYYYLILLIFPLIYGVIISGFFIYHQELTVIFAVEIIGIYVIPVIISTFITYYNYKKLVVLTIKGGK